VEIIWTENYPIRNREQKNHTWWNKLFSHR